MTGRDAVRYIIVNGYDDAPLVIYVNGKPIQVFDICFEPGEKELVILLDT